VEIAQTVVEKCGKTNGFGHAKAVEKFADGIRRGVTGSCAQRRRLDSADCAKNLCDFGHLRGRGWTSPAFCVWTSAARIAWTGGV
jgi:hypothetical protein